MRSFLLAVVALLAAPATSLAATPTLVARDVPLHAGRTPQSTAPARFDMVGLHWQGSGTVSFRTRGAHGWSGWQVADGDAGTSRGWHLGQPVWTGTATRIAYRTRGAISRLRAYLVWSPVDAVPMRRLQIAGSPPIIPRLSWGADESIRRAAPQYASSVRFAVVHHTAGTNSYTPQQSAAIVRGIEVYHVKGNGWNDIGYNFLVDRYGQVFEGRWGGVDKAVVGAHAEGFNSGSTGVSVIGNFASAAVPAAARNALEQLLAWRLDLAHVDPLGTLSWPSGGNPRFPAGVPVFLRNISGHRDTGFTDCPGNVLYDELPAIAGAVAAIGLPKLYAPVVTGKVGGPVRIGARISSPLPWTVTVKGPDGADVASGSGTGTTADFTWDATTAKPARYTWTIAVPGARPATGVVGGALGPLTLRGLAASPPTITAGAASTRIRYTLSVPATVTATLQDHTGATVATLFSGTRTAGVQAFSFSADEHTADGRYTILLDARSADGQHVSASVALVVDRTLAGFAAEKKAFSPNGDDVQDTLRLPFALTGRSAVVRVEILRGQAVVASPLTGEFQPGPQLATWNGMTDDGLRVHDGTYQARITVTDDLGTFQRGVTIVLDTRKPRLRVVSWRRLRFSVDEPVTVTLTLGGRTTTRSVKKGAFSFSVRGVPRRAAITATDAAGNSRSLHLP